MELSYLLLSGSLSGLVSVLGHAVGWSAVALFRPATADGEIGFTDVFLHMLSGAALGLLFWLSWGLAAVVDVTWWQRGVYFGSLCWLALAVPPLIGVAVTRNLQATLAVIIASRWATTCLITGLACAWGWAKAP